MEVEWVVTVFVSRLSLTRTSLPVHSGRARYIQPDDSVVSSKVTRNVFRKPRPRTVWE